MTQNKIELRRSHVDLTASAREAADVVRDAMRARELTFSMRIPEEPLYVDADPARLQQIQINLLSNAAKYTPRGGHVDFELGREDGAAVLQVRDDGAGIARPMLESVFDLFVQSNRTLDRASGGLGVGLTLARALVQLHGGSIAAESDGEGKGSRFSVRLPLVDGASEPPLTDGQPCLPAGARIVVVEDNADSRELLCELLKRAGFECHTAESGPAALELIDEVRPDIAILDVGLPEMDGYEVARQLRQKPDHENLLLIALTGYGRSSDRSASRQAGFNEHLVKPVRADQLLSVLADMQNASSRQRHAEMPAAAEASD